MRKSQSHIFIERGKIAEQPRKGGAGQRSPREHERWRILATAPVKALSLGALRPDAEKYGLDLAKDGLSCNKFLESNKEISSPV